MAELSNGVKNEAIPTFPDNISLVKILVRLLAGPILEQAPVVPNFIGGILEK